MFTERDGFVCVPLNAGSGCVRQTHIRVCVMTISVGEDGPACWNVCSCVYLEACDVCSAWSR